MPLVSASVETSVTNNSPSQDSDHSDDLFQSKHLLCCALKIIYSLLSLIIASLLFEKFTTLTPGPPKKFSILYQGPKVSNSLSFGIRNSCSFCIFLSTLRINIFWYLMQIELTMLYFYLTSNPDYSCHGFCLSTITRVIAVVFSLFYYINKYFLVVLWS